MKINWTLILVGLAGIIFGAVLQYIGNTIANKKLKEQLIAELTVLINKQKTARITGEEQKRITELQSQLKLLERK